MARRVRPRKDTALIPKWGSATLLVPVMDYDAMTMFHCHILEHEDIGMMGAWHRMMGMTGGIWEKIGAKLRKVPLTGGGTVTEGRWG